MRMPNFKEFYCLEIEEHKLYHVSPKLFNFSNKEVLGTETNWHTNGALGLWASTKPLLCSNFGKYTYEFSLRKDSVIVGWDLSDFFYFCMGKANKSGIHTDAIETRDDYIETSNFLIEKGIDVIYILDTSNCINEVIILNYTKIDDFHLVNKYCDSSIPITVLDKFLDKQIV